MNIILIKFVINKISVSNRKIIDLRNKIYNIIFNCFKSGCCSWKTREQPLVGPRPVVRKKFTPRKVGPVPGMRAAGRLTSQVHEIVKHTD